MSLLRIGQYRLKSRWRFTAGLAQTHHYSQANKVFACLMLSMFEQSLIRPAVVFRVFVSLAASG
jgi:hypothetical protein